MSQRASTKKARKKKAHGLMRLTPKYPVKSPVVRDSEMEERREKSAKGRKGEVKATSG